MNNKRNISTSSIGTLTVGNIDYTVINAMHYTDGSISFNLMSNEGKTTAWFSPNNDHKDDSSYAK